MNRGLFDILLILVIAGLIWYIATQEPEIVTNTETITDVDTVYIEKEPIKIVKYIEKLETDTIHVRDTVYITEVASIDTVFDEGELSVDYYVIPQIFDIEWSPYPKTVIMNTKYVHIYHKAKWYEKPLINVAMGAVFTGGVVWLVK